ncbi:MAG TPA: folylpolyglutamate synthase/dihydrofolate synthase family protein [Candidatus Wallbacteria bacterium]|nr:folylpolyglutamate synthase/dihydrofolate synthase family protein [Candidatus Wallbacteria bacterium]
MIPIKYNQAIEYLESSISQGVKNNATDVLRILNSFGDPQKNMNVVHITGTNGKGSTAAYVASILEVSGQKVGLFTSPHLSDFRERIRINGKKIGKKVIPVLLEKIKAAAESLGLLPSYFEIMTIVAVLYFSSENCDVSVVEVGLGGRLDSTNILYGKVCVITGIDFDHVEYLGNTLEDIAREKVAIVKPGSVLIVNVSNDKLYDLIEKAAYAHGASDVICVRKFVRGDIISSTTDGIIFDALSPSLSALRLKTPLVGNYQLENAKTAISVVEIMKRLSMTEAGSDCIKKGLLKTKWPGRFEIFGENGRIVIDGAHNASGMSNFVENLRRLFPFRRIRSIVGILKTKDYGSMLDTIAKVSDEIIITGLDNSKKPIDVQYLKDYVTKIHGNVKDFKQVSLALEYAEKTCAANDLICITGSLYLIGEVRPLIINRFK